MNITDLLIYALLIPIESIAIAFAMLLFSVYWGISLLWRSIFSSFYAFFSGVIILGAISAALLFIFVPGTYWFLIPAIIGSVALIYNIVSEYKDTDYGEFYNEFFNVLAELVRKTYSYTRKGKQKKLEKEKREEAERERRKTEDDEQWKNWHRQKNTYTQSNNLSSEDDDVKKCFGKCQNLADVKKRYRQLCKVYHPDNHNSHASIENMQRLQNAYEKAKELFQ